MKNAKMMLTAIAVVAVVGGALAFNVQSRGTDHYCTSTDTEATSCKSPEFGHLATSGTTLAYATTTATNCGGTLNPGISCTSTGIIVSGE